MRYLLAVILSLVASAACAQTQVLILDKSLVDNTSYYAAGTVAKTSRVSIPSGKNLYGLGRGVSILQFPADGTITDNAVTIVGYGSGTTTDRRFATVGGVAVDGQYDTGQGEASGAASVADGVELDGQEARIESCVIRRFKGTLAKSRLYLVVKDCTLSEGYTGIELGADSFVHGNVVSDIRDYGLHVQTDAGNCWSYGNHYFGCNNGGVGGGGTATGGAACKVDAAVDFRGTSDVYADSYYGVSCAGADAIFTNCFFQHNTERDVSGGASGMELHSCNIKCMRSSTQYGPKYGVEWTEDRCGMFGGTIEMNSYIGSLTPHATPATGFRIDAANLITIDTRVIDNDGVNGTTGAELVGLCHGTKFRWRVYGFEETSDRLVKTNAACKDVDWEFHGDFGDMTNPGTESAGIKKYLDIVDDWVGTIKFVDISDGTTVTLTGDGVGDDSY